MSLWTSCVCYCEAALNSFIEITVLYSSSFSCSPSFLHPLFLWLVFFKGKPDLNTSLPVRQTASIFKQPVTKVTNHPNNKVKTDPQKAVDQPRQVNLRPPLTAGDIPFTHVTHVLRPWNWTNQFKFKHVELCVSVLEQHYVCACRGLGVFLSPACSWWLCLSAAILGEEAQWT